MSILITISFFKALLSYEFSLTKHIQIDGRKTSHAFIGTCFLSYFVNKHILKRFLWASRLQRRAWSTFIPSFISALPESLRAMITLTRLFAITNARVPEVLTTHSRIFSGTADYYPKQRAAYVPCILIPNNITFPVDL